MDLGSSYGNPASRENEILVVRAIYDAFARRDIEGALRYIADDIEFFPSGTATRLGRTEPYRGHDGIRDYFADAARVWDDIRLDADDVRAAAGAVVVFGHVDAVLGGEPVRRRAIWNWRVQDGKAVSMRVSDLGPIEPGPTAT